MTESPSTATERAYAKLSIHEVVHLVLKRLPAGILIWVLITVGSIFAGLFSLGYNVAVYTQKPSEVESKLISQKDALQSQLDKQRDIAEERRHTIDTLASSFKGLAERNEQFIADTNKLVASLKDEQRAGLAQRDQALATLNQTLAARAQEAQQAATTSREREQALTARAQEAQRLADAVKEKDAALQQRDQMIASLNQAAVARIQETQRLSEALKEKDAALQQRDQTVSGLNQSLGARAQDLQKLAASLKERDDTIRQRDQSIAALTAKLEKVTKEQ